MRTARAVLTVALTLTLLIGAEGALLVAQTAPAAAAPTAAPAAAPAAEEFSKEQLEQLVAPIALYSDALLMQVLMASTYPLEVVEADRFMKKNPELKDDKLEAALKDQDWDPSVKSMCTLPDVLKRMSENLDWTQDLGDAFLGQKDQLLDTVQFMRGKAHDSGNLKSSEQQTVTVKEDKIIVIESPSPEVVYVPTYSPTVVYGGWSYPSYYYPPMYPYYPPGAGLISFGIGMAVGGAIWGNCNWGWGHHDVDIDVNRYNNFNRNTNINHNNLSGNRANWNHDASHRSGVNYKNSKVAGQYGAKAGTNRVTQGQAKSAAQARGYSGSGTGNREARASGTATRDGSRASQAGGGQGAAAARDRQASSGGQGAAARDRSASAATGAAGSRDRSASAGSSQRASRPTSSSYGGSGKSAYSGSSKPSYDRAASSRGSSSRGTSSYGGSRGGGSRGGGGGRRR
jgi:hypothetical protein